MKKNLAEVKVAARQILDNEKLLPSGSQIALWYFSRGRTRMGEGFTDDRAALKKAIDSLQARGGTPLAQALRKSGTYLIEQGQFDKKILIVLSDGRDTSGGNPTLAIRALEELAAKKKTSIEIERK